MIALSILSMVVKGTMAMVLSMIVRWSYAVRVLMQLMLYMECSSGGRLSVEANAWDLSARVHAASRGKVCG